MRTSVTAMRPPQLAAVYVDATGTGKLYLDGMQVNDVIASQPDQVMRVLLDYAAAVDRDGMVVTRHWDGRTEVHELRSNGTLAAVCQSPAERSQAGLLVGPRRRQVQWGSWRVAGVVSARLRSWTACARTVRARWSANFSQALMLVVLVLVLIGSVSFLVIAPYLWLGR